MVYLADDLFFDLTQLVYLDLSSKNRIESIEENAFSNLKNLANLDLSFNSLSMLNPKSFIGLENLKIFELSCNNLKYLDQSLFNFICNTVSNKLDLLLNQL